MTKPKISSSIDINPSVGEAEETEEVGETSKLHQVTLTHITPYHSRHVTAKNKKVKLVNTLRSSKLVIRKGKRQFKSTEKRTAQPNRIHSENPT